MTRKIFVPLIIFVLVLCGTVLCISSIHLSEKAVSVDITNSAYCKDVLVQISHQVNAQTMPAEEVIDFSNSFLLYNFAEEPIAIFYKIVPVGYAIYDFTNGIVLQCTDEGYLNLATGSIKKLNVLDYLFSPNDFYAR